MGTANDRPTCNQCWGDNLERNGTKLAQQIAYTLWRCSDCGANVQGTMHNRAAVTRGARVVTETEAWCNKGRHMVAHQDFAKGQNTCRDCRRTHYARNNYSLGKTCMDCGVAVVNNSTGRCIKCSPVSKRGKFVRKKRRLNTHGYMIVAGEWDHPNANNRGQVLEHVKVMSEALGRPLLPGENVHHKNGVRDDNRPENLELWVTSQPSGQRPADLVVWAHEILKRYDQ
jgi:transposase-like protein